MSYDKKEQFPLQKKERHIKIRMLRVIKLKHGYVTDSAHIETRTVTPSHKEINVCAAPLLADTFISNLKLVLLHSVQDLHKQWTQCPTVSDCFTALRQKNKKKSFSVNYSHPTGLNGCSEKFSAFLFMGNSSWTLLTSKQKRRLSSP